MILLTLTATKWIIIETKLIVNVVIVTGMALRAKLELKSSTLRIEIKNNLIYIVLVVYPLKSVRAPSVA